MAKPSTLKNLVVTLLVITLLSAIGLGGMNYVTQEPIAKAKSEKVIAALKDVLPDFNNDPTTEKIEQEVDGGKLVLYSAKKDGEWVGTAVESFSPKGFGGRISVMFGFDTEGKISGACRNSWIRRPYGRLVQAASGSSQKPYRAYLWF